MTFIANRPSVMNQAPAPPEDTSHSTVMKTRNSPDEAQIDSIIDWFRAASPYINDHRGKTLVLALPGEWLRSELLPTLTHDLTLLSHLGLRLVVCFGLRAQVDEVLARSSMPSAIVAGRRVTDEPALKAIIAQRKKDANDLAEFEAIVDMYKSALGM